MEGLRWAGRNAFSQYGCPEPQDGECVESRGGALGVLGNVATWELV